MLKKGSYYYDYAPRHDEFSLPYHWIMFSIIILFGLINTIIYFFNF